MERGCLLPSFSKKLNIESNAPYKVSAIQTDPQGYIIDYCMKCHVKPTPFAEIIFERDDL